MILLLSFSQLLFHLTLVLSYHELRKVLSVDRVIVIWNILNLLKQLQLGLLFLAFVKESKRRLINIRIALTNLRQKLWLTLSLNVLSILLHDLLLEILHWLVVCMLVFFIVFDILLDDFFLFLLKSTFARYVSALFKVANWRPRICDLTLYLANNIWSRVYIFIVHFLKLLLNVKAFSHKFRICDLTLS